MGEHAATPRGVPARAQENISEFLHERLSRLASRQRQALEATLKEVDTAHEEVELAVRRVRSVPDMEWPRYAHDLESKVDGLERSLRSAR